MFVKVGASLAFDKSMLCVYVESGFRVIQWSSDGANGGDRTHDLQFTKLLLYH